LTLAVPLEPLGRIVIQSALGTALQLHAGAVFTVKEPKPPCPSKPSPEGKSEYEQGFIKIALMLSGLPPEFTVSGFVVALAAWLTAAELNTYCVPLMDWGLVKLTRQFVLALQVKLAGEV